MERDYTTAEKRKTGAFGPAFWIAVALLVLGVFVFWVLPSQLGDRPVKVEFQD